MIAITATNINPSAVSATHIFIKPGDIFNPPRMANLTYAVNHYIKILTIIPIAFQYF